MEILIKNLQDRLRLKKTLIGRAARAALMARRMAKKQGTLNVCFVGDTLIRRLNARFHSSNRSTDVLAFDISRSKSAYPLNDVVISVDTAIKNASKFGTSPDYELCLYVVHGILHLSGLDDGTARQRQIMDKKAGDILKKVIKVKKMAIQKSEAIVIRRMDFRETSLIVDFFTRDFGKISGLLKGFRSDPRKFASSLELFSHNDIIFYMKNTSSLHLVSGADIRENFDPVRRDMNRAGLGSFMMELLGAVMPVEDKNQEVFDLTLACLNELKRAPNPERISTIFKIKMLALSGFKPHFDSCLACHDRITGQSKFSISLGGLLCERCFGKDTAARVVYRGTVASILYIEKNDFAANLNLGMNPQIKRELDIILNAFLNYHLEKELKSQKVLNKMAGVEAAV